MSSPFPESFHSGIPESEIHAALTHDGRVPLDYTFVFRGRLKWWNPSDREIWVHMFEDNNLYRSCAEYLKERGQAFEDWGELLGWAESHNWRAIDALRRCME
jgi:hypothetical protein